MVSLSHLRSWISSHPIKDGSNQLCFQNRNQLWTSYNHIERFNGPSSPIRAPKANQSYQDDIATGRLMSCEYGREPSDEHLYKCNNIQSFNKPSSPTSEGHAANQTYQDDKKEGQQATKDIGSAYVISHDSCFCLILLGNNCFIDNNKNDV